ncbi:MAG: heme peroxidase [Pirellulaceae bacterium]|nr:MAG: heme peroxidase [Pirellulaceae bacterium]
MNIATSTTAQAADISLEPLEGWHCTHIFYRIDRAVLAQLDEEAINAGRRQILSILDPDNPESPARLQVSVVSGHKADFGLMLMDANPLKVEAVNQRLLASELGPCLVPVYSFVSMTEVSEYVPTVEQYAARLKADGEDESSPAFQAKVRAYAEREPLMRRQRLTPDFPKWPATCFYPMSKKREAGENWFTLPFAERNRMMAEHARSGMEFAGKVMQLITVGIGLDDWEWGVTLWARNPQFLREIVYRMRFDEASARYALFGPFYVSYVVTAEQMLAHTRLAHRVGD